MNIIIPKNKRFICFRSAFQYPDNIQAVLDALIKSGKDKKYKLICIGNGFDNYHQNNIVKVKDKTVKAMLYFFISKYVVWDVGIFYSVPAIKSQISLNLWHGTSLKKIGFYEEEEKPYRTSTYAIAYSPLFAEKISHAFDIPLHDVLVTGEPRNDYFAVQAADEILLKCNIPVGKDYRYVIWMPTFRQSKNHNVNNGKKYEFGIPLLNSDNIDSLDKCAAANKVIIILKWHGSQILPKQLNRDKYSNLVFLTNDQLVACGIPFYSLVSRCHALITDYSSIYVNYMVLDRPICFAYDDFEEYVKDRGFMFDNIDEIMPGFKARSFDDILRFVEDTAKGEDRFKKIRHAKASLLNTYVDFNNGKRVIDALKL